jgi:calcineurin-like phosphoesterase family protein
MVYLGHVTHYNHKNIVRGTTSWENFQEGSSHQSTRDFDTVEEHNETLISSFNGMIKENDILYHLGDWSFGGHEKIKEFRDRLNCKNIHLIFGNHDQHIEKIGSPYQSLFSSLSYKKEISFKIDSQISGKYGKTNLFLSHYSHQVWNQSHHGNIHLFGHSHGSLKGIGRSMDVGVDTNNLYPYHLDEIIDIMKNIPIIVVDHHNENTN